MSKCKSILGSSERLTVFHLTTSVYPLAERPSRKLLVNIMKLFVYNYSILNLINTWVKVSSADRVFMERI